MPYICFFARSDSSVPDLVILTARDDAEAEALACDQLARTPDYLGVEVCEDERLVRRIERPRR